MPVPLIETLTLNSALAATASSLSPTMPVQPVSALQISLTGDLVAADALNTAQDLIGKVSNVSVQYNAQNIFNGTLRQMIRYAWLVAGLLPRFRLVGDAIDSKMSLSAWLPFGTKLMDPMQGLPRSSSGQLTATLTTAADQGNIDSVVASVTAFEMPSATPASFTRCVAGSFTPAATGAQATDLVRIATLLGIALEPTKAVPFDLTDDFDQVQLLIDNTEVYYNAVDSRLLGALVDVRGSLGGDGDVHNHISNVAATYTQFAAVQSNKLVSSIFDRLLWLTFMPGGDERDAIATAGLNQLSLKLNILTAEAIGLLPIYRYTPAQFNWRPVAG